MKVTISTQHIDNIDSNFQKLIQEKAISCISKHINHPVNIHVNFTREGNHPKYRYGCDFVINGASHSAIAGHHFSEDMHDSFNVAMSHVEKQLAKEHSKTKDHNH